MLAGRYKVERLLGEGAAGTVWLVRDTREKGRVWAVKELDYSGLTYSEQQEAAALFQREAEMLQQLEHTCLPKVIEHFSEQGRQYLVMERVEGPTLESIAKGNPGALQEGEVLRWAVQLCEVLHYLHTLEPPVVYRDLKPANVMVSVRGPIKLIDFGIARALNPTRPGDTTAYGTPGYAPMEQYVGKASPRSDLYALGATLYRLLTGQEPEQFRFTFRPAREWNPLLTPSLEHLLAQLLEKESEKRPGSAWEVKERLQAILENPLPWWWHAKMKAREMLSRMSAKGKQPQP